MQKLLICVLLFHGAYSSAVAQRTVVHVSGRLFNVEGEPFNDRTARAVLRLGTGVAGLSNIGTDGGFDFPSVSPGDYSLSLTGTGVVLSPVLPVHVANTEVRDLTMIVPRAKQVSGQVTLDGAGPLPQVRLQLKPVKDPTANPAVRALSPSGFVTNDSMPGLVSITPMVDLYPRPDGAFVARIPDGDWIVSVYSELPAGYAIKALTYGSVDILRSPLKVRLSEEAAVRLAVISSAIRLSHVYGRITGLAPELIARGPMSVSFMGPVSQTRPEYSRPRTAVVRADGTFDMDEVLPGDYSVMVTGLDNLALSAARLSVAKADVRDFEIKISRTEIRGQVVVEGSARVPALTLGFRVVPERGAVVGGPLISVPIRPLPDGTFTALLPEEEPLLHASVSISAACGYKLKSMIFGATDVMRLPLKVLKADTSQLQITLTYSECRTR